MHLAIAGAGSGKKQPFHQLLAVLSFALVTMHFFEITQQALEGLSES